MTPPGGEPEAELGAPDPAADATEGLAPVADAIAAATSEPTASNAEIAVSASDEQTAEAEASDAVAEPEPHGSEDMGTPADEPAGARDDAPADVSGHALTNPDEASGSEAEASATEVPNDGGEVGSRGLEPVDLAMLPGAPADEVEVDPEEPSLDAEAVRGVLEALIFASPEPITPRQIGQVLSIVPKAQWQAQIEELAADYARAGRGLQLIEVAGGWQITTRPECNDWVRELLDPKAPTRLSIQALETLAVIAYKQPVTMPEVIELRGVKSGGVIKTLLEKRLIRIVGRKEVVGRPMLYGTTKQFLLHFGLKDLVELPKVEEFAEVLGEEVDVVGLKRAIETPTAVDVPLAEAEPSQAPTEASSAADSALEAGEGDDANS